VAALAIAEDLVSLLDVDALAFGYPGHPVGRDLRLRLDAGEVVALLGPNGSGKTTLFRTILGTLPPQGGTIRVDGESITEWPRRRLARVMAYVPQAHAGMFPFTAIDVVLMGRAAHLRPFAVPSRRDHETAEAAMRELGVEALAGRVFTELSGGERQLVLIARALAQQPRLLVMDEPAASLDFGNQVRLLDEVARLRTQGLAVLMSTHHPEHARRVADRVVLIKHGQIVEDGPPAERLSAASLGGLYDIDPARLAWPGEGPTTRTRP
jgi:iron complex transport system ATP-binding protein